MRVYRRANAESLEYLVDRMPARIMDALNQRLFVMDMCLTLVRYVVEGQRLNDIRSLYDWDYAEAWGDKDYAGFRTIDDAERALIEDAFRRKNLAVREGNPKCLDDVVSAHVRAAVQHRSTTPTKAGRRIAKHVAKPSAVSVTHSIRLFTSCSMRPRACRYAACWRRRHRRGRLFCGNVIDRAYAIG
ncbi:hypothetical protein DID99_11085 [Burkholderia sp. Bp8986]|nr:hypothetical protein DID99_11085 [Burkholderia sp. Bp8986]